MILYHEIPTDPFLRHALAEKFLAANTEAAEIMDQNDRAVTAEQELDDPDFLELAMKGLALEQNATLEKLAEYNNPQSPNYLPYRELALAYLALEDERKDIEGEITSRQKLLDKNVHKIDRLANTSMRLAPLIESEARALAETKKLQLGSAPVEDLMARLAELKREQTSLDPLISVIGRSWRLPQVPQIKALEEKYIEQVIDEIPVPPVPVDEREAQAIAEYAARHVDAPEASKYIAYWLSQMFGEIVTVDDLIEFIYDRDQVDRPDTLRSRITTMLGPKLQGPRIKAMLAEDDLILQYGWRKRRLINTQTSASRTLPKERIYRAMFASDLSVEHLQPFELNERYSEEEEISDSITWTDSDELTRLAISNSAAILAEEFPEATAPGPERFSGRIIPYTEMPQAPKPVEEGLQDWRDEFKVRVDYAISVMQKDGLMHEGAVDAATVKLKSSSTRMGTDTAFERLRKAKLLTRQQVEYKTLHPSDLITMYLFNSHQKLLTGRFRQEALAIIEQALKDFFAEERSTSTG